MKARAIENFLDAVCDAKHAGLFNPWAQSAHDDTDANGPNKRLERLRQHLACDAKILAFGEAPSYQGARCSGIAFTSERLMLEGAIPRISAAGRLSTRDRPWSEPSATTVWKQLYLLGVAEETVLWNALAYHPYKPGVPLSNRTPSDEEMQLGLKAAKLLREAFPKATVVAVGRLASKSLSSIGIPHEQVRHPSMGGVPEFVAGMRKVINKSC